MSRGRANHVVAVVFLASIATATAFSAPHLFAPRTCAATRLASPILAEDAPRSAADLSEELKAGLKLIKQHDEQPDAKTIEGIATRARIQESIADTVAEMKEAGLDEEQIIAIVQGDHDHDHGPPGAGGTRPGSCPPQPVPTSGEEEWGKWAHRADDISIELKIDDSINTKQLAVDVAEGWLLAGPDVDAITGGDTVSPLLFGRLVQPVLVDELTWAVDEDSNGDRVLLIDIPKKAPPSGTAQAARIDCVFDETLHINGEAIKLAGLSEGTITIDLPTELREVAKAAGATADVKPADSSKRGGDVRMNADGGGRIDVSDLGLTMADLEIPLPELEVGGNSLEVSGFESTSRLPGSNDQGCEWTETADQVEAILTIPGLRGQPAMALAVELTSTTATITAFGQAVWSCLLRGEIDLSQSSAVAEEGEAMGVPLMRLVVRKAEGGKRWGGLIESIGEDSILQ